MQRSSIDECGFRWYALSRYALQVKTFAKAQTISSRQIIRGTHSISIEKGSLLNKQISKESVAVNSFHHQAVKDVAPGFKVTARSKDGIVEAIEMEGSQRVFGVQFHPEVFTSKGDDTFLGIFKHLINEASKK